MKDDLKIKIVGTILHANKECGFDLTGVKISYLRTNDSKSNYLSYNIAKEMENHLSHLIKDFYQSPDYPAYTLKYTQTGNPVHKCFFLHAFEDKDCQAMNSGNKFGIRYWNVYVVFTLSREAS